MKEVILPQRDTEPRLAMQWDPVPKGKEWKRRDR